MKTLRTLSTCALAAAGVVLSASGQIQTAGNLQVSLDAASLPVGPVSALSNAGVSGGVFQSVTNAGVGPQVIALGGNGTHGILFDGNSMLVQEDGSGNALFAPTGITGTTPNFSVEAWVYAPTIIDDNPVVSWGTRGNCGGQVSCAYGSSSSYGGLAMWCNDHGWGAGGTPAAGVWHHLAWTLDSSGNENLYADGALKATYTGVTPNIDPNNNLAIAYSHDKTAGSLSGGVNGGVIVGRVRVHDGVLTAAQVANNYNYERAAFTNGTPTFLAAKPLHRWSFTHAVTNDAVGLTVADTGTSTGSAAAVVQGIYGGATAQFTGTQLNLNGGSSSSAPYVDLPNGLISSLSLNRGGSGQITLEAWVAPQGAQAWARVFDFGSNTLGEVTAPGGSFSGQSYFTLAATPNNVDLNHSSVGFQNGNLLFASRPTGSLTHIAVLWDDTTGTITVYENGIEVTSEQVTNRLNDVVDINDWLGRSNWSGDNNLQGGLAEFRIFNRLLSPAELLNDYQVGPTVVDKVLKWNGNVNGTWDLNTTANWLNGTTPVTYQDGGTVQFDDTLSGTPNVNLTITAQPASLTFNNSLTNYTLTGSGKISGSVGLTKSGLNSLTLGGPGLNDYTGTTLLNGGTLIVTNLANGGTPSAIGASSAAAANLTLAGGTLSYRGPATTINRSYLLNGNSALDVQGDLTLSSPITALSGSFTKLGAAKLTYNAPGYNKLTSGANFMVGNGTVVLDGTAGQTNTIQGETWVGSQQVAGGALVLTNTVLTNTDWFAVGRGNGTAGFTSTATLYNSLLSSPNLSLGYDNGIAGNRQTVVMSLNGTSKHINTGNYNLSESPGSSCTLNVNDSSVVYSSGRILVGLSGNATGAVVIANSGAITNLGWTSIGDPGVGTATLKNNAVWQSLTDFNVTDNAGTPATPSFGTLNIQDNALLVINTLYVGKNTNCTGIINQLGGTLMGGNGTGWRIGGNINGGANQLGIYNLSGGTLKINGANFNVGAYGTGYFNQTGGTAISAANGNPVVGRFAGATGYFYLSAGTFTQLGSGNSFGVGDQGTGELDVSGTGVLNIANNLVLGGLDGTGGYGTLNLTNGSINITNNLILGANAGCSAYVNLYGGTLSTRQVSMNNSSASSYLNFYGGTLHAGAGANANFLSGLSGATVYSGGAFIDTDTNTITIAQDLYDGGSGSLTKLGAGKLTLAGNLYYTGPTTVGAGKLTLNTGMGLSSSGCTVADGAEFDVSVQSPGQQVALGSVTLGSTTGCTLDIELGAFGNATAAPLNAFNSLTVNGTIALNVTGSGLTMGEFPLIAYGSRTGAGNFVLGALPPGVLATIVTNTSASPATIDLNITAVNELLWSGLFNNGAWDVNTTVNWTNLLTGSLAAYVQGSSVIFDDTASGTNFVNLTTTLSPSSVLFSNSALAYTLGGVGKLSGPASVTLYGSGSVTLASPNNNYSGSTLVSAGSLVAGVANALSSNSPVTLSGATLNVLTNAETVRSLNATNAQVAGTSGSLTSQGFILENTAVNAALAGPGGLLATGASGEIVSLQANSTYSGPTVVAGGTLVATSLANGGQPSSVGASSASPTNLVLAGGTLSYQGPAAAVNRGYELTANSTLDAEGNLTLSGPIAATAGTFAKAGPGTLTYTGAGTNQLSAANGGQAYGVANGLVVLDGTAGQTNLVSGDTWVGFQTSSGGALLLTNSSLNVGTWLAIARGTGPNGFTSTATLYNSTLSCGDLSLAYDNGIAGNNETAVLTLNGNSRLIERGDFNLSESPGSSGSVILNGNSVVNSGRILMAMSTGATGTLAMASSSALTNTGWVSIGVPGTATATLQDNAVWESLTDFNVTDTTGDSVTPSVGVLNVAGNALLRINTLYVGKSGYCSGTVNQTGGAVLRGTGGDEWRIGGNVSGAAQQYGTYNLLGGGFNCGPNNLQIGAYGQGEWYQTNGAAYFGGFLSIGRFPGGLGQADISGGTFAQTNPSTFMIVGEQGTGTLNISGSAVVTAVGGVSIGHQASGIGTVNLNGGVLSVTRIFQPNSTASGTFNFNGGLLSARSGSYPGFMSGLSAANVLAGGALIDSGANNLTIGQPLLDGGTGGGLTKLGAGSLALAGACSYTGPTTVSAGTLLVNSSLASSSVDVRSGAILGGNGSIAGSVTVESGGTLNPGGGIGTLTLSTPPALNGSVLANLDRNGGSPVASLLVVSSGTLAYQGTLVLANTGAALVVGDTFTLFNAPAYSGAFTIVSQTPGQTVTWDTSRLAIDGTVKVTSVANTSPVSMGVAVSGSNLQLSWPSDHTGWRLLVQTNHLNLGISTNALDWGTVPGSTSTNFESLTIDPAKPTEFYRLVYP